jgi:hypothetical protein
VVGATFEVIGAAQQTLVKAGSATGTDLGGQAVPVTPAAPLTLETSL